MLIHSELMDLFLPISPGHKIKSLFVWGTKVFFLENDDQHSCLSDPADHSRLTEHIAKAFCLALCPHLKLLKEDGMTKLGLRVTLDSDQVRRGVLGTFETGLGQCLYFLARGFSSVYPESLILWIVGPTSYHILAFPLSH